MARSTARRKASTSSDQLASKSSSGLVLYLLLFPDGKRYVGLTKNLRIRLNLHRSNVGAYERAGRHLSAVQRAIKNFGIFEVEILQGFEDRTTAQKAEEETVRRLMTFNPKFGYNESLGKGRLGLPHLPETRAKQSQAMLGNRNRRGKYAS